MQLLRMLLQATQMHNPLDNTLRLGSLHPIPQLVTPPMRMHTRIYGK